MGTELEEHELWLREYIREHKAVEMGLIILLDVLKAMNARPPQSARKPAPSVPVSKLRELIAACKPRDWSYLQDAVEALIAEAEQKP